MGRNNAALIRACEKARRAGSPDLPELVVMVEESQRRCEHPERARKARTLSANWTSPSGKIRYRAGHRMYWCGDCSKLRASVSKR
jgi:hypothetical protein